MKRGIDKVLFPPKCRGSAEDLVKKLCRQDPSQRLAMKPLGYKAPERYTVDVRNGGTQNIKDHGWYEADRPEVFPKWTWQGFDWTAFQELRMPTPYQPAASWVQVTLCLDLRATHSTETRK